ncbi:MAG: hypothetical protein R3F03_14540 [Opitutaceae bacterium]
MMPPTPGSALPRLLFRRIALFFTVLLVVPYARSDSASSDAWQSALNLDYNAAAATLEAQHRAQPDDARIAIAFATSLLVRDPVTANNIAYAQEILETLLARLTQADTTHRPLVIYLLGRIAHDHVTPAQLDVAQSRYAQLRHDYPRHPLADQAAVHLAYIVSLDTPPSDPLKGVAAVETLLASVASPAARRELHFLIAHLHWQGRGDAAAALPHYIAGRAIGFEAPYRDGEVDLTIAGLAAELGRDELAAQHYLAFVEAHPRDARAQTARRLASEARARIATTP